MKEEKKAHWEVAWDGYYLYCSNCHQEPSYGEMPEFCPNCGADMKDDFYYEVNGKGENKN